MSSTTSVGEDRDRIRDRVQVTVEGRVASVVFDRPNKLNALDEDMFLGIAEAGERIAGEVGVRAVVLSGSVRGFCAGLDVEAARRLIEAGRPPDADDPDNGGDAGEGEDSADGGTERFGAVGRTDGRITHLGQQAAHVWQEVAVPVIAAVHGVALGGGLQIAMGADIRICAPDARLSVLEIRWGLIPDMTGTWMLRRLVGLDVAKELTFTGRMVDGAEAVRLGLATRVDDEPLVAARAMAAEIASKSPDAVRAAKRLLNRSGSVPLEDQFAAERREIGRLIGAPNQVEAVMAALEGRVPSFEDPGD